MSLRFFILKKFIDFLVLRVFVVQFVVVSLNLVNNRYQLLLGMRKSINYMFLFVAIAFEDLLALCFHSFSFISICYYALTA